MTIVGKKSKTRDFSIQTQTYRGPERKQCIKVATRQGIAQYSESMPQWLMQ